MFEPSEEDLLEAVKESLKNDGRLDRFKAELRSAVLSILNRNPRSKDPPQIPEETKLINDLIREYLTWNGYKYTDQILAVESGRTDEPIPVREILANKLGVMDDFRTAKIPLLYYVVSAFKNQEVG